MKDTNVLALAAAGTRRPRAQSMQHFSNDKTSLPRDCCSSGSFVSKLYRMVDSEPSTIVSWIRGGTAFCIVDPKMMAEHCLPKYFRHRRFSSLIRQLNFYSFYRVQEGQLTIYQHSYFRKGRPDLLVHIKRRGAGKAKDPWFDPLANPNNKPQHSQESTHVNLGVIAVNTQQQMANGMMCYSPMSKPLTLENMSPALKPGMAPQMSPPVVDLGGSMIPSSSDDKVMDKRWDLAKENDQLSYPLSSSIQLKNELYYDGNGPSNMMMGKSSVGMMQTPLDLDIQDFLTDDCSINATMGDMKSQGEDRYSSTLLPVNAKYAMVSRDCLKWDGKVEEDASAARSSVSGHMPTQDDGSFEDELLLDLANVEPGAWDVPLSPLNDEEDMMPWLDLCF